MILFLSKYPHTKEEFRDGFFQRVVDIDSFFKNDERVYLNVQLFRNYSKTIVKEDNKTEYNCNLIIHFLFILSIYKKSNLVYIQSLHNVLFNFLFIKWIKKWIQDRK